MNMIHFVTCRFSDYRITTTPLFTSFSFFPAASFFVYSVFLATNYCKYISYTYKSISCTFYAALTIDYFIHSLKCVFCKYFSLINQLFFYSSWTNKTVVSVLSISQELLHIYHDIKFAGNSHKQLITHSY